MKGVFIGLQLIVSIIIIFLVSFASKFMFSYEYTKGWIELYDTEKSVTCNYLLNSLIDGEYLREGDSYSTELGYFLNKYNNFSRYVISSNFPKNYFSDLGKDSVLVIVSNEDFNNMLNYYKSIGYNLFCSSPVFGPSTRGYALLLVKK